MAENIVMPQLGESIAEGTIVKWLKEPGSTVNKDENVVLISTDKVEAEIPSPSAGILLSINVGCCQASRNYSCIRITTNCHRGFVH
jgi:pyruvate dehydrogenase E2 component (dihydrolipoamide acetyltransferase)